MTIIITPDGLMPKNNFIPALTLTMVCAKILHESHRCVITSLINNTGQHTFGIINQTSSRLYLER